MITKLSIDSNPSMDPSGMLRFQECILNAKCFLEFGCGGSTALAIRSGIKEIISVDSSKEWLQAVRSLSKGRTVGFYPVLANIGPTKSWGYPLNAKKYSEWHKYAVSTWSIIQSNNLRPDLILIDGRFRVFTFLYSLLYAETGTTILFDDYGGRPAYHVVEKFLPRVNLFGRMAEFKVVEKFDAHVLLPAILKYSAVAA